MGFQSWFALLKRLAIRRANSSALARRRVARARRDITEHAAVTESLCQAKEASEIANNAMKVQLEELEQLYRMCPVGLALLDRNCRFLRLNERLAELSGIPVGQQLGRTIREIYAEYAVGTEELIAQVFATGKPLLNREIHGISPTDSTIETDWLASYFPVKSADGSPLYVGVVIQDVTERKRQEVKLRNAIAEAEAANTAKQEQLEELELVYRMTPVGLALIDSDYRNLRVNEKLAAPPETLPLARQLFADVLDLPGGMRIGTIHAFCQSLLRRFPLEAGLSPHFALEDEVEGAARRRAARETVLARPAAEAAIEVLAAEADEQGFAVLTDRLAGGQDDVQGLLAAHKFEDLIGFQRAALAADGRNETEILRDAMQWPAAQEVQAALLRITVAGPAMAQQKAAAALEWLSKDTAARQAAWQSWYGFFFGQKKHYELSRIMGGTLAKAEPWLCEAVTAEQRRIAAVEDDCKAARLAVLNAQLLSLIAPVLEHDALAKRAQASVSYADLIATTAELLRTPGAEWVLYKLDGGIDHLLLDEVQDTAPAQWQIAGAIAAEFFAGVGARAQNRSIFAVGDAKQSIFSFQGADLDSFEIWRGKFRALVTGVAQTFVDGALSVSFRSTDAVLGLVDAVFAAGPARLGVCAPGEVLAHQVSRAGQAGRVTLWPLTPAAPAAAPPDWAVPATYAAPAAAKSVLAVAIARHIQDRLARAEMLPSRGRAVRAGDFLVLVRRRDALVGALTRELKTLNIPVAGLDRMVLTSQQAVSDLLAFCDALLLPEDDLAMAQYLASPLGGLSDDSLMQLAIGRRGTLFAALAARRGEQADWAAAHELFEQLRGRVDFISPHALLTQLLGRLGGRAKLLRRLGAEAAEAIDELLAEALSYTLTHPVSLQSFVHELRQSGAAIKREAEAAGDVVRIMTVHGAKGLQAPIVILPDTVSPVDSRETLYWLNVPGPAGKVPVYCPRAALRTTLVQEARAASQAAQQAEQNRLLYVALTRAEDELLICGAETRRQPADDCWYRLVAAGFERLAGVAGVPFDAWPGVALSLVTPQAAAPDRVARHATVAAATALPDWAGAAPDWLATAPAHETARPETLAPSRAVEEVTRLAMAASPLGNKLAAARGDRAAALQKGRLVHALLEHLPALPGAAREVAALRFLTRAGLEPGTAATIVQAVTRLLDDPALAALFGPGSRAETPLAGVVGDVEIGGLVDRLCIREHSILIADYKTDRLPPVSLAGVPASYIAQLSAYRSILAQIYPDRSIDCLLIWTETATAMTIPTAMLTADAA